MVDRYHRQIVIAVVKDKQRVIEHVENVHLQFQGGGFPPRYLECFLDGDIKAIQRQALSRIAHQVTAKELEVDWDELSDLPH